jgi:methyl-accepting chemotaxis protein
MNQDSSTDSQDFLLAKRSPLSRYVVLLLLAQCLVLISLAACLADAAHGWINAGIGAAFFAAAYLCAMLGLADSILSMVLAAALIMLAALIVASCAPSHLVYLSHCGQVLALGVISLYRNRRLMALATVFAVLEQLLSSIIFPGSLIALSVAAHDQIVIEHFAGLIASGVVLMMMCELSPLHAMGSTADALQTDTVPSQGETSAAKVKALPPASLTNSGQTKAPPAVSSSAVSKAASAASEPAAPAEPGVAPEVVVAELVSVGELIKVATDVGARAQKLSKTITNLEGPLKRMVLSINGANRGMQEIKEELSRTAASVIQITRSSEMHANKANEVFQAADEAAAGSQIGASSTEQSIVNMNRIREQMDSIAQRMDVLLSKSQKMVQVVGFADELALQSKVLSVNAAIEAAKAGERGQGFTAVATEVKSLANQSKEATREVRQILKEIQKSISEVRLSIAMGNETVELASDQCRSTAESIRGLDWSVSSSRDAAEAIMVSSKDQVQGIMQISHAMNDIQTVSEQNSGSLGNLQVEAQKLNNIARELLSDMKGYQILVEQLLSKCGRLRDQEIE